MAIPTPQLVKDVVAQVEEQIECYILCFGQPHSLLHDLVTLKDLMNDLPAIDDDRTVDLVLDTCLQRDLQSCACLAAVCFDRVERLLCSAPTLVPDLEDSFWREALVYLAQNDRWSCIQSLLARGKGRVCWDLLGKYAAEAYQYRPVAFAVFDLLAAWCFESECSCIKEYVKFVTQRGLLDRFKILVYSGNTTVRQFVLNNLVNLVFYSTLLRLSLGLEPQPWSDLNGCLIVACEAGLFSAKIVGQSSIQVCGFPTAMCWAVRSNQPDLVRFLYHAGGTSNRDLFQQCRSPILEVKTKAVPANVPQWLKTNEDYPTFNDVDAAKNIHGFLTRVASTPRSLEALCLLQVSGHLGWGHGRESKIEQLKIPNTFKQALKFKDHKEFLK